MSSNRKQVTDDRRRRIVELTAESSFLRPADIADQLNVSPETIRRDLLVLEETGLLRRVHGGALAVNVNTSEPSRVDRSTTGLAQKRQIADIVAQLVSADDIVFMDVGTTIETAAEGLPADFTGTLVTNSLAVGALLNDRSHLELHMLGGRMRVGEMTTYGPDTLTQLGTFNASIAFIGSGGIDLVGGMTDYSPEDVAIKQLMIKRSTRTYILATAEKFGIQAKRFVCALDDVDGVITDGTLDPELAEEFRAGGVEVITPDSFARSQARSA
jgi:DeoR/GlpR family transcriptional regulator of sugar metabolism